MSASAVKEKSPPPPPPPVVVFVVDCRDDGRGLKADDSPRLSKCPKPPLAPLQQLLPFSSPPNNGAAGDVDVVLEPLLLNSELTRRSKSNNFSITARNLPSDAEESSEFRG